MRTFQRSEPRRGEPTALTQKPPTSISGPAGATIALQRSIGNRAVTSLTAGRSGRRLMRNGWSVKAIDEERDRVKVEMGGKWGSEITLHHTISQDRWSSVAKDLNRAMSQQKDRDLHEAAKDFWDAVQEAAGKEIIQQTGKRQDPFAAALDNLPLNLEAGPSSKVVGSNPGTGFDPVTIPGKQSGRVISPVSAALLKLDDAYRIMRRGEGNPVEQWREMAKQMRIAQKAHESVGQVGHHREMWFESNQKWYRKGTRAFPGLVGGKARFAERASTDKEKIAAHKKSPALVCEKSLVFSVQTANGRPKKLRIRVPITQGLLHHSCMRHTYRHFDFGDIKAVNNFWPPGYDYSKLEALAPEFATAVAEHFRDIVLDKLSGADRELWELHHDEITAGNVPAGKFEIFFIGSPELQEGEDEPAQAPTEPEEGQASKEEAVEDPTPSRGKKARGRHKKEKRRGDKEGKAKVEEPAPDPLDGTYTIRLKTLAPDGPLAEAYTVEDLGTLAEQVPHEDVEENEDVEGLEGAEDVEGELVGLEE